MSITNGTLFGIMQTRYCHILEYRDEIRKGNFKQTKENYLRVTNECVSVSSAYGDIIDELDYESCNGATFDDYNPSDDDYRIAFVKLMNAFYTLENESRERSQEVS